MGGQGEDVFGDDFDDDECGGHDGALGGEVAGGVDELGKEGAVEEEGLGVGDGGEQALVEQVALGGGASAGGGIDMDRGGAPELDAEPDEIGAAEEFEGDQGVGGSLEEGADAEQGEGDEGDEADRAAGDGEECFAVAVDRAVGDGEQAVGARRDGEADGGEDVEEEGLGRHLSVACPSYSNRCAIERGHVWPA